jgi:uncharacterized protein
VVSANSAGRHLLDSNMVIALLSTSHQHHLVAQDWFGSGREVATSSITQMSFLRYAVRNQTTMSDALVVLESLSTHNDHQFWVDTIRPDATNMQGVIGHRQVTDFYLAALAREHQGRLATLDAGFAAAQPDVVDLVTTTKSPDAT